MGTVIPFPAARVLRAVPSTGERPFAPKLTGDVVAIPPAPAPWHMRRVQVLDVPSPGSTAGYHGGRRGRVIGFEPLTGRLLVALDYDPRAALPFAAATLRLLAHDAGPEARP